MQVVEFKFSCSFLLALWKVTPWPPTRSSAHPILSNRDWQAIFFKKKKELRDYLCIDYSALCELA